MSLYEINHIRPVIEESEYCYSDSDRFDWSTMVVVHEYDDESVVFGRERTLDTSSSFKVDLAVRSYQKGNISLGRAAEMADLPYGKMIETLKARGVPLRFGATVEVAEKRSKKLVDKLKQIRGSSS